MVVEISLYGIMKDTFFFVQLISQPRRQKNPMDKKKRWNNVIFTSLNGQKTR